MVSVACFLHHKIAVQLVAGITTHRHMRPWVVDHVCQWCFAEELLRELTSQHWFNALNEADVDDGFGMEDVAGMSCPRHCMAQPYFSHPDCTAH